MDQQTVPGKSARLARKVVVLVAAALLLWFVGGQGLAMIAARGGNPALAQLFDPGRYPGAGYQLGRTLLAAGRPDLAVRTMRPAVSAAPMNVRFARVLGQALGARDEAASARVMRAAEKLGWRDTPTSLWVLRDAALANDLPRAIDQIDALARRQVQSDLIQQLFQAGISDDPSRRAFAAALAKNPPWRSRFFASMRTTLPRSSQAQMASLLDLLDQTGLPLSPAERMTFIDRLVDVGDGAAARAYWARTFGISPAAAARTPYDPTFDAVAARAKNATVSPFEWRVGVDAESFVAFDRSANGHVLAISPATEGGVTMVAQALLLSPGNHRIDADIPGNPVPQAPAGWQVTCVPSGTRLIRSFATPGNELSGVSVTIPATGCDVQTLALVSTDRIDARALTIRSVSIR